MEEKVAVLFVCMGNICRSPTAQGVFEHLVSQQGLREHILIDSAGTHAYHVGNPPDRRAQQAAAARGIDLSAQRARQVQRTDFERFDYILVMDRENESELRARCPDSWQDKIQLLLDYAPAFPETEVPDPYYGGQRGFEQVLDLIEAASEGLLEHLRRTHFPVQPRT